MSLFAALAELGAGYMQARSMRAQARLARVEAQQARIRGRQIAEQSREELATVLGNIEAIRASRGVSGDSATAQAIERRTVQDALRAEGVAVLAELNRSDVATQQARGYSTAARFAMPLATLNAAQRMADTAAAAFTAGRGR